MHYEINQPYFENMIHLYGKNSRYREKEFIKETNELLNFKTANPK